MIITLSGRSGVGKTSLVKRLVKRFHGSRILVSWTTRPARPGDTPGEYEYVPRSVFENKEHDGDFFWTVGIDSHQYGTARRDLAHATDRRSARYFASMTFEKAIELHHVCAVEGVAHQMLSFYLLSPPPGVLRMRMRKRGDDEESIERRVLLDAEWDRRAQESKHPFVFIPDINADIEDKVIRILSYLQPTLSENPPP